MAVITKFFNNLKAAFILRADDYQLSIDDSKDNGGKIAVQATIDFETEEGYKVYRGSATRTTEIAHSGSYSLKIEKAEGGGNTAVAVEISQEARSASIWAYIEALSGSIQVLGLVTVDPENTSYIYNLYIRVNNNGSVDLGYYHAGHHNIIAQGIASITLNQWNKFALEWDPDSDTVVVYVNDQQVWSGQVGYDIDMRSGTYSGENATVNIPFINFNTYSGTTSAMAYFDDVETTIAKLCFIREKFFGTFTSLLTQKNFRASLGVITRCWQSNELDPFNDNSVQYLKQLVQQYGFEAADHTRWHNHTPRTQDDVLGAIDDIESVIENYNVLTYIFPFGEYDDNDLNYMDQYNIPIGVTVNQGLTDIPSDWKTMGITNRLTKDSDVNSIISEIDNVYNNNGVYYLLVHPHTYEWDSADQLANALSQVLDHVLGLDMWITTFGELWSYTMIRGAAVITKEAEGRYRVQVDYSSINNGKIWKVPITIEIDDVDVSAIESVKKNGVELPQATDTYKDIGTLDSPREFYRIENDKLYVTIVPTGDDVIEVTSTNPHFKITTWTGSVTTSPGSTFTVTVGIENDGGSSGTVEVRLKDSSGTVVDSKQVTLDAGANAAVELSATAPDTPGTYTYTVEAYNTDTQTVDDTKDVTVTVQQQAQPTQPTKKEEISPLLILGGLLLLVILLSRRR